MKCSAKVIPWGAFGYNGLSNLHSVLTGKVMDSNYYIEHEFKKERKPCINRKRIFGKIHTSKLIPYPGLAVFMQNGATPHTETAAQAWCNEFLLNFIETKEWPCNLPDLNCIEILWSILEYCKAYKDPCTQQCPSYIVV